MSVADCCGPLVDIYLEASLGLCKFSMLESFLNLGSLVAILIDMTCSR